MGFASKRKLYESLPLSIKRAIGYVPFSVMAGRAYRSCYRRKAMFERASHDVIRHYQEIQLGKLLQFVSNEVPAYQSLRPLVDRLKPFDAIQEFPWLDKDQLQKNFEQYLPRSLSSIPHYEATTGGTSGNQLKLFLDDHIQATDLAFIHRAWQRVGFNTRHRKATFRGLEFSRANQGEYWQLNPIYNELQVSPFHMTEKNLGLYIEVITQYRPEFFHGYPSAIDNLAEFVIRNGHQSQFNNVKAIFLASEGASAEQRTRIETAFGARAFAHYGQTERVLLAAECESSSDYHNFPDYGILEFIDSDGRSLQQPGDRGELVGTGFINKSLPLVRYRTGDMATRLESHCRCGRNWEKFSEVVGRWRHDMIIGKQGAKISVASLNMHGSMFDKVRRYQYYQRAPGKCILRVMPSPGFSDRDSQAIERAYEAKVGNQLELKVQLVDDIQLTPRGKLKLLESTL